MLVRFNRQYQMYHQGDIAFFSENIADLLIKNGAAEAVMAPVVAPATVEPDEAPAPTPRPPAPAPAAPSYAPVQRRQFPRR